jgi:hypothetical protein
LAIGRLDEPALLAPLLDWPPEPLKLPGAKPDAGLESSAEQAASALTPAVPNSNHSPLTRMQQPHCKAYAK